MASKEPPEGLRRKRKDHHLCSVLDCKNTYDNTVGLQPPVRFFRFPNRPWETERKKVWVRFVRRQNPDKTPWAPSKSSLICSRHFVENERSEIAASPSYNPTIFNVEDRGNEHELAARFQRFFNRAKRWKPATATSMLTDEGGGGANGESRIKKRKVRKKEIGCQTEGQNCQGSLVNFHSTSIDGIASTYVQHRSQKDEQTWTDQCVLVDRLVGPDCRSVNFLGYNSVENNEEALRSLAYVSPSTFCFLLRLLVAVPAQSVSLRIEDRLLLFLMKLRHGLPFEVLGVLFNVHRSTASRIFLALLETLSEKTKDTIAWPSRRSILETLPKCFAGNYSGCRAIIDCTEINCQRPPEVQQQNCMWNDDKGTWTVKFLVSIAPDGLVTFISNGYGGHASDSYILRHCGFLQKIKREDVIMSDIGFANADEGLDSRGIFVDLPPFAKPGVPQLKEGTGEANRIANVRSHVDRMIQRIKTHNILTLPLSNNLLPHMDSIMQICCILNNMQLTN